ncbi:MAG: N-acetyl-gamma-glutamyl-phosphate reductase [Candidatus Omnitrophica bacterium]|nr:N-acetyl-gamma-glutamyl-phosphate reductase [Candidatus Omnitrophota bacterium]
MINVAICGITGYTGLELIRILLRHPKAAIKVLTARFDKPVKISDVYPEFRGRLDITCQALDSAALFKKGIDIIFLALPHKVSMEYVPGFIDKGKKVIDLSADFRIKDAGIYEKYYGIRHIAPQYIKDSVYGLPELNKAEIRHACLLANPGCYPTGSILAVAPLIAKNLTSKDAIILNAVSGVTGAGKKPDTGLIFAEVSENAKAYKVGSHQHVPEMEQELARISSSKVNIIFTPHLIPVRRGILTTAYVSLKKDQTLDSLIACYRQFYKNAPFVNVYDANVLPQIKDVVNTNTCAIGMAVSSDRSKAIIVTAIDNLQKGASGQAVQNMNIMFGLPETMGLV